MIHCRINQRLGFKRRSEDEQEDHEDQRSECEEECSCSSASVAATALRRRAGLKLRRMSIDAAAAKKERQDRNLRLYDASSVPIEEANHCIQKVLERCDFYVGSLNTPSSSAATTSFSEEFLEIKSCEKIVAISPEEAPNVQQDHGAHVNSLETPNTWGTTGHGRSFAESLESPNSWRTTEKTAETRCMHYDNRISGDAVKVKPSSCKENVALLQRLNEGLETSSQVQTALELLEEYSPWLGTNSLSSESPSQVLGSEMVSAIKNVVKDTVDSFGEEFSPRRDSMDFVAEDLLKELEKAAAQVADMETEITLLKQRVEQSETKSYNLEQALAQVVEKQNRSTTDSHGHSCCQAHNCTLLQERLAFLEEICRHKDETIMELEQDINSLQSKIFALLENKEEQHHRLMPVTIKELLVKIGSSETSNRHSNNLNEMDYSARKKSSARKTSRRGCSSSTTNNNVLVDLTPNNLSVRNGRRFDSPSKQIL